MKNICTLLLVLSSFVLSAQITLENTYSGENLKVSKIAEDKTVYYYAKDTVLTIYNLNNSIYKTLTLPFSFSGNSSMIYFVSETLFDSDDAIEYMYVDYFVGNEGEGVAKGNIKIYDTDGSLLLSEDSIMVDKFHFLYGISPMIMNTENGTKLILRKAGPLPKETKIYSLGGALYTSLKQVSINNMNGVISAYPNPTRNTLQLNYHLPEGVKKGVIKFFDLRARLVKEFKVDQNFDHLAISVGDIRSGSYYYVLETSQGYSGSKQLIVVE